jgi:hypothetical protein
MYADKSAGRIQKKLDFNSTPRGYEYPKTISFIPHPNVYQFLISEPK